MLGLLGLGLRVVYRFQKHFAEPIRQNRQSCAPMEEKISACCDHYWKDRTVPTLAVDRAVLLVRLGPRC